MWGRDSECVGALTSTAAHETSHVFRFESRARREIRGVAHTDGTSRAAWLERLEEACERALRELQAAGRRSEQRMLIEDVAQLRSRVAAERTKLEHTGD